MISRGNVHAGTSGQKEVTKLTFSVFIDFLKNLPASCQHGFFAEILPLMLYCTELKESV